MRRVIERALPELTRRGDISRVIFCGGESPPSVWLEELSENCQGVTLESLTEREAGYVSELGRRPDARALRAILKKAIRRDTAAVWLHNPALGRNPFLVREVTRAARADGVPLLLHHHDFWCDNRWPRWRELTALGYRHPDEVAEDLFPAGSGLAHVTLNSRDTRILRRSGLRVVCWPNPFDPAPPLSTARRAATRRWLRDQTGASARTRFWVLPCRLLRRKNILEALHLCRIFDPGAILVTSTNPSSAEELPYAIWLKKETRRYGWPLHFVDPGPTAGMDRLLASADVVALTSLQEGFGLAFLEAQAAGRPLVCRRLPGVSEDLAKLGFCFPHGYEEMLVPADAFSWGKEHQRQTSAWQAWKESLPTAFRSLAEAPPLLTSENPAEIGFSRLSGPAQAEVIGSTIPARTRRVREWLSPPWPEGASALSGEHYARRFWHEVRALTDGKTSAGDPCRAQNALASDRLRSANLYPLLFPTNFP